MGAALKYFAYGSNMSIARLRGRVPSAVPLGRYALKQHDLRFHKSGSDGSGKCNALYTGNAADVVIGALFEIEADEKPALDAAEGLGQGYNLKRVTVVGVDGAALGALTYIATRIDNSLRPYSWYLNHVLVGAQETALPNEYIERKISSIEPVEDMNDVRNAEQLAIHR